MRVNGRTATVGLFYVVMLVLVSGCGNEVINVPPGYIAKILTPSGYDPKILEAGQVDIGQPDSSGRSNQLIWCEATSVTIKESFGAGTEADGEDHRVITRKKAPIAVDIYVQVMVPDDKKMRDSIFAQVTPVAVEGNPRLSTITLEQIYEQFARSTIRGKVRQIFAGQDDYTSIMAHYDDVNTQIARMVANTFNNTRVPLKLLSAQLSNVKADQTVWAAENKNMAAATEVETIDKIGAAIRRNPGYLERYKWEVIKEAAGKETTIIINEGGRGQPLGINVR